MRPCGVVSTIGGDLGNVALHLRQQVGKDFVVVPVGGGHLDADDVLGRFIHGQVDLAPGAALAYAVLAYLPLAFTDDLQPGGVRHDMRRASATTTWNLPLQCGRPTRHVGVVRYRQVQSAQTHQVFEQAFSGPVGQKEQRLERQAGLNRYVRVKPRFASTDRRRSPTLGKARVVKPDRQIASIDQRTIIFCPVRHPIAILRLRRALVCPRPCGHLDSSFASKPRHLAYIAPTPIRVVRGGGEGSISGIRRYVSASLLFEK